MSLSAIGYLVGGRLELQARTLTRAAYSVFVPALAFALAIPFTLDPIENAAGILQAGMPTAILVTLSLLMVML